MYFLRGLSSGPTQQIYRPKTKFKVYPLCFINKAFLNRVVFPSYTLYPYKLVYLKISLTFLPKSHQSSKISLFRELPLKTVFPETLPCYFRKHIKRG